MGRLLTETDAPYMTPEPMRGVTCGPEHVLFTAERMAQVRGCAPGPERAAFLQQLLANACGLLDRGPTPWQREAAGEFGAEAFGELPAGSGAPHRRRADGGSADGAGSAGSGG